MLVTQFSYQLTIEDFRAGYALDRRISPVWLDRLIMIFTWTAVSAGSIFILAMLVQNFSSLSISFFPLFLMIGLTILMFLSKDPGWIFKLDKKLGTEQQVRLYSDRIEKTTCYGNESLMLSECYGYKANFHTILLYSVKGYFTIFRDRHFESPEQFETFRSHLMSQLKPVRQTRIPLKYF